MTRCEICDTRDAYLFEGLCRECSNVIAASIYLVPVTGSRSLEVSS